MATKKKTKTNKTAQRKPAAKKPAAKKTAPPVNEDRSFIASPLFIHGAVWAMMFVFSALFMYIDTRSTMAEAAHSFFGGILGVTAYMLPVIICGTLAYFIYTRSISKLWLKFVLCILELVDVAAMIGVFAEYSYMSAYTLCGASPINGGGLCGVFIAEKLKDFVGAIATMLILLLIFIVLACFISSFNIIPYIRMIVRRLMGLSDDVGERVKTMSEEHAAAFRERMEEREKRRSERETLAMEEPRLLDHISAGPEDDVLPKGLRERIEDRQKQTDGGIKLSGNETIDIANRFASDIENGGDSIRSIFDDPVSRDELYNMKFDLPDDDVPEDIEAEDEKQIVSEEKPYKSIDLRMQEQYDAGSDESEQITDEAPTVEEEKKPREKNLTDAEKEMYSDELDDSITAEIVPYKFPGSDLLDRPQKVSADKRQELYRKAEQLIAVLDNFGVKAKPVQVTQGPTVTRYEIQPSSGTKLSKIVGLADDIALNLAVSTVLIAPVPGKAATVGVEIPNNNVTPVTIREMLESPEFKNAKSKLTVCLGKDIGGNVVVGDIAKWPHALIAGATGSGKSVCINTIITSILYKADPNEVKLIMVDPKQVELGIYNGIPHLLIPVVTEAKKAAGALNWAVQEMMRRYDLFKNAGVRKLEMYNKLMEKNGGEKIPQLVIIIDELADLMMVAAKEVEDYICRLAQLARAAGIHLIIATQRPSVDVITGLIKANVPSRIAFFVSSQVDSRTILDKAGAEKLLGMGDMLYFPAGARSTTRVQGAFVSDGEVERIVDFIKDTSPQTHYREDLADHIERIQLGENGVTPDKDDDGDPLLNDAIKLAVELGKISTSMVQRRLSVGYSRAGRIIDQMEARGVISPANGAKPRDVLISHADFADNYDDLTEE